MINILNKYKILIEVFVVFSLYFLMVFKGVSLFEIIVNILSLIVIWEVIRMLSNYAIENSKVMKLRIVIDGFIVFFLRDLVLIFSNEKYSLIEKEEKLIIVICILFALFVFRIMSLRFSPNDKNCENCPSIKGYEKNNLPPKKEKEVISK